MVDSVTGGATSTVHTLTSGALRVVEPADDERLLLVKLHENLWVVPNNYILPKFIWRWLVSLCRQDRGSRSNYSRCWADDNRISRNCDPISLPNCFTQEWCYEKSGLHCERSHYMTSYLGYLSIHPTMLCHTSLPWSIAVRDDSQFYVVFIIYACTQERGSYKSLHLSQVYGYCTTEVQY